MRYDNLLCPLTTLYRNLCNQSMFYLSYTTLYDFQEIFSKSKENEKYTVLRLWIFLYDPYMISRKSYMILVWQLRNHTNHIWPCMNIRNHIWPSMTTKNFVLWATRGIGRNVCHFFAIFENFIFTMILFWSEKVNTVCSGATYDKNFGKNWFRVLSVHTERWITLMILRFSTDLTFYYRNIMNQNCFAIELGSGKWCVRVLSFHLPALLPTSYLPVAYFSGEDSILIGLDFE